MISSVATSSSPTRTAHDSAPSSWLFKKTKVEATALLIKHIAQIYCVSGKHFADLHEVFRTGQRDYTIEMTWDKWQTMCDRWGKDYRAIKLLRNNVDYKAYMTYLNYTPEIQADIHKQLDRTPQQRLPEGYPNEDRHAE